MNTREPLQERKLPSWRDVLLFPVKAWGLRVLRGCGESFHRSAPARHARADALLAAPVLAEAEGSLWPPDEADDTLVVGKIHNLRLAAKRMHGLEVPAGATFSFWKQLGRASTARGFVRGRELREGCVVPAIGGGLCQLSNTIYDSAVRAGIEVVERHRHSRVLPGSLAEFDRDATVFWNYLDLRLKAPFAWRLEIALDAQTLRVRIRGDDRGSNRGLPIALRNRQADTPGDCTTCNEHDCARHLGAQPTSRHRTWLLFDPWPEFLTLMQHERGETDRVIGLPHRGRTRWLSFTRARAALCMRWALWRQQPLPKARGDGLEIAARAIARRLRPDDLDLVIEQGLLPYLWRAGELAGRRFEVLMNALPMDAIQQGLDIAAQLHPESATLRDFRAPAGLLAAERDALAHATHWISPHAQVIARAGLRATPLEWLMRAGAGARDARGDGVPAILFPASALARKGVIELAAALDGIDVRVLAPHGAMESADVWRGVRVQYVTSMAAVLTHADLVVLPAWIEHQPRSLLAAIANGIPVIATAACGLSPSPAWRCVPAGDVAALRSAILESLAIRARGDGC